VRLTTLGDFAKAAEATRKLTADLDALAGRTIPARLEAVIRDSVQRQTRMLEAEVIAPPYSVLRDDGVVIVPTRALAGARWSMLPALRGRSGSVSPPASPWLATWLRLRRPAPAAAGLTPALVAGPGLTHAIPEVTELAALYPGSTPVTGDDATVDATLEALDG